MNASWVESLWLATDDWCLRWLVTLPHCLWQGVDARSPEAVEPVLPADAGAPVGGHRDPES